LFSRSSLAPLPLASQSQAIDFLSANNAVWQPCKFTILRDLYTLARLPIQATNVLTAAANGMDPLALWMQAEILNVDNMNDQATAAYRAALQAAVDTGSAIARICMAMSFARENRGEYRRLMLEAATQGHGDAQLKYAAEIDASIRIPHQQQLATLGTALRLYESAAAQGVPLANECLREFRAMAVANGYHL
jgi:hypothetical protein